MNVFRQNDENATFTGGKNDCWNSYPHFSGKYTGNKESNWRNYSDNYGKYSDSYWSNHENCDFDYGYYEEVSCDNEEAYWHDEASMDNKIVVENERVECFGLEDNMFQEQANSEEGGVKDESSEVNNFIVLSDSEDVSQEESETACNQLQYTKDTELPKILLSQKTNSNCNNMLCYLKAVEKVIKAKPTDSNKKNKDHSSVLQETNDSNISNISIEGNSTNFIRRKRKSLPNPQITEKSGEDLSILQENISNDSGNLSISIKEKPTGFVRRKRKSLPNPQVEQTANNQKINVEATLPGTEVKKKRQRRRSMHLSCSSCSEREKKKTKVCKKSHTDKISPTEDEKITNKISIISATSPKSNNKKTPKATSTLNQSKTNNNNNNLLAPPVEVSTIVNSSDVTPTVNSTPLIMENRIFPVYKPSLSGYKIPKRSQRHLLTTDEIKSLDKSLDHLKTCTIQSVDMHTNTEKTSIEEDMEVEKILDNSKRVQHRGRSKSTGSEYKASNVQEETVKTRSKSVVALNDVLILTNFRVTRSRQMFKLCDGLDVSTYDDSYEALLPKSSRTPRRRKSTGADTPKDPTDPRNNDLCTGTSQIKKSACSDVLNKGDPKNTLSKSSDLCARKPQRRKSTSGGDTANTKVPKDTINNNNNLSATPKTCYQTFSSYSKPCPIDLPETPLIYTELLPSDPRRNYKTMIMWKDIPKNDTSKTNNNPKSQKRPVKEKTLNTFERKKQTPVKDNTPSKKRSSTSGEPKTPIHTVSSKTSCTPSKLKKRRKTYENDDPDYEPPNQLVVPPLRDSLYDVAKYLQVSSNASETSDLSVADRNANNRSKTVQEIIHQPTISSIAQLGSVTKPFAVKQKTKCYAKRTVVVPHKLFVASSTQPEVLECPKFIMEVPFEQIVSTFFEHLSVYGTIMNHWRKMSKLPIIGKDVEEYKNKNNKMNLTELDELKEMFRNSCRSIPNKNVDVDMLFQKLSYKMQKLNIDCGIDDMYTALKTFLDGFEGNDLCNRIRAYLDAYDIKLDTIVVDDTSIQDMLAHDITLPSCEIFDTIKGEGILPSSEVPLTASPECGSVTKSTNSQAQNKAPNITQIIINGPNNVQDSTQPTLQQQRINSLSVNVVDSTTGNTNENPPKQIRCRKNFNNVSSTSTIRGRQTQNVHLPQSNGSNYFKPPEVAPPNKDLSNLYIIGNKVIRQPRVQENGFAGGYSQPLQPVQNLNQASNSGQNSYINNFNNIPLGPARSANSITGAPLNFWKTNLDPNTVLPGMTHSLVNMQPPTQYYHVQGNTQQNLPHRDFSQQNLIQYSVPQQKVPGQHVPIQNVLTKNIPSQNAFSQNVPPHNVPLQNTQVKDSLLQRVPVQRISAQNGSFQNEPIQKASVQNIPTQNFQLHNIPHQYNQQENISYQPIQHQQSILRPLLQHNPPYVNVQQSFPNAQQQAGLHRGLHQQYIQQQSAPQQSVVHQNINQMYPNLQNQTSQFQNYIQENNQNPQRQLFSHTTPSYNESFLKHTQQSYPGKSMRKTPLISVRSDIFLLNKGNKSSGENMPSCTDRRDVGRTTGTKSDPPTLDNVDPNTYEVHCPCGSFTFFACTCKQISYCSTMCQINDWPHHRVQHYKASL